MLSVTSFYTNPLNASYGASKAAGLSLANGIRLELHLQGTLVVAVHAASSTPAWPRWSTRPRSAQNPSPG
jgi:short-subunit dehydrogenase